MLVTGLILLLDSSGKEVRRLQIGRAIGLGGAFDVLPNGNILVPNYRVGEVAEYDQSGKKVWSAQVRSPTSATRLPGGNTLVASNQDRRVVEIDRAGREVWEHKTPNYPPRAYRR